MPPPLPRKRSRSRQLLPGVNASTMSNNPLITENTV
jgi:hypothetical protein